MTDEPTDDIASVPDEVPVEPADEPDGTQEPEVFDRAYVEALRAEAAEHRVRAKRADHLAQRLLDATVREVTGGMLVDPTDLPTGEHLLDEDGYPDPEAIRTAAEALIEQKPHLADRRPKGTVDQGARPEADEVDLASVLRRAAG